MSDQPHGPGWWQASNDKWYPPEKRPEPPASRGGATGNGEGAPGAAASGRSASETDGNELGPKGKAGCFGALGAVAALSVLAAMCSGGGGGGSGDAAVDLQYAAFDVCTQFVEDQLVSPGSAEFPNEFEDDGEVTITSTGSTYTVRSHVDSENGFGALLQSPFTCVVRHTGGDRFQLEDLQFSG